MKKIILALAVCATIASCQKKEDKDPIDVSKTTYLMNGKWQMKGALFLPDINDSLATPQDTYTGLPGCEKDNYYIFNTLNRTSLYEGGLKCSVLAPDSTVYGYTLSSNDQHLEVFTDPDGSNHDVVSTISGDVTYSVIDSFAVTHTGPNPSDSTKTARFTYMYKKVN